jgi:hypothetical protein
VSAEVYGFLKIGIKTLAKGYIKPNARARTGQFRSFSHALVPELLYIAGGAR